MEKLKFTELADFDKFNQYLALLLFTSLEYPEDKEVLDEMQERFIRTFG